MSAHCPGCALDPGACVQHPGGRYTPAAADLARELLSALPNRYAHSLGVGRRANQLATLTDSSPAWVDWITAAGLAHDVGYGSPRSGMHAQDGAEVLAEHGGDLAELAPLVAWHSTALWEYAARGMPHPHWERPVGLDAAVLWVADFTTTPTGEPTTMEARVASLPAGLPGHRRPRRLRRGDGRSGRPGRERHRDCPEHDRRQGASTMSCYEWERGEIRLPTAEFSKVRQSVQDTATRVKTEAFEMTQTFWKGLSRKEQTDPDAYHAARCRWAQSLEPGPACDEALDLIGYHSYPAVDRKPSRVKKSDVDFPTNRTTHFHCDDLSVTFDRKSSTLTWAVSENNHAVEHAHQTWLAGATKSALSKVRWTGRNTGGVLVGNDEYNRESDYVGGGGNYVTTGYGPVGALEAPSHTDPYTDSKGRRMHGESYVGKYGLRGRIVPYKPEPRGFGYGYGSQGGFGSQGRHPAGTYGGRGGQFAPGVARESDVQL